LLIRTYGVFILCCQLNSTKDLGKNYYSIVKEQILLGLLKNASATAPPGRLNALLGGLIRLEAEEERTVVLAFLRRPMSFGGRKSLSTYFSALWCFIYFISSSTSYPRTTMVRLVAE
jgi:hypothetical protein